MRLRQKVIVLAVVPLVVALCAIVLYVRQQGVTLAAEQRACADACEAHEEVGDPKAGDFEAIGQRLGNTLFLAACAAAINCCSRCGDSRLAQQCRPAAMSGNTTPPGRSRSHSPSSVSRRARLARRMRLTWR